MWVAIVSAVGAIAGAVAAYIAYKNKTSKYSQYALLRNEIEEMEAELERLRALGGNANAYAADRLRVQISERKRVLEHLSAAGFDH